MREERRKRVKRPLDLGYLKITSGYSYTVSGNVNWGNCPEKQCGGSLKKLKINLPHDLVISLLDKFLEKTNTLI